MEAFTEKNTETLDDDLKQLLLCSSSWSRELMVSCTAKAIAEAPAAGSRPKGRKGRPTKREHRNSRSLREVRLESSRLSILLHDCCTEGVCVLTIQDAVE